MDYDDTFCEKDKTKCGQLDRSFDEILVLKEEIARLSKLNDLQDDVIARLTELNDLQDEEIARLSELNDLQDDVIARLTLENTGLRITNNKFPLLLKEEMARLETEHASFVNDEYNSVVNDWGDLKKKLEQIKAIVDGLIIEWKDAYYSGILKSELLPLLGPEKEKDGKGEEKEENNDATM